MLTVSHNSKADIHAQMGVPLERLTVVPVGVDHTVFRPYDDVVERPGRLMVTTSSDVPDEGPRAPARGGRQAARRARHRPDRDRTAPAQGPRRRGDRRASGSSDIVTTITGVSDEELARLYGEAQVAVVPSLYEGFSLPAIEAMACAVPVVATTGGALPEVVGVSGETGLLVEPNDPDALVAAISTAARRRGAAPATWAPTGESA